MEESLTVVDLFCGCGGFSEGFRQAGFEIVLGVDIWEIACKSFEANFPEAEVWQEDVTKLKPEDIPKADVLIGGPECKDFSVANTAYIMRGERKKKPDMSQIKAFLRIAKSGRFKYWIMENVPPVRKLLPGLRCRILNSADFGTPQSRKRAFFGNYPLPPKHPSKPGEIANTITASIYKGGLNDVRRRFFAYLGRKPELIDVLYYQGFPLNWVLFGTKAEKFEQVGNAVPPPVAKAIGYAILLKERGITK